MESLEVDLELRVEGTMVATARSLSKTALSRRFASSSARSPFSFLSFSHFSLVLESFHPRVRLRDIQTFCDLPCGKSNTRATCRVS